MAGAGWVYRFHVLRTTRKRYDFPPGLYSSNGDVVALDLHASRLFVQHMNQVRRAAGVASEASLRAGDLNGSADDYSSALAIFEADNAARYPIAVTALQRCAHVLGALQHGTVKAFHTP